MKSRRININIIGDVTDAEAIEMVSHSIAAGRISENGTTYCFVIVSGQLSVSASRTRAGHDTFHVWRRTAE